MIGAPDQVAHDDDDPAFRQPVDGRLGGVAFHVLRQSAAKGPPRHAGTDGLGAVVGLERFDQPSFEIVEGAGVQPGARGGDRRVPPLPQFVQGRCDLAGGQTGLPSQAVRGDSVEAAASDADTQVGGWIPSGELLEIRQ